MAAHATVTVSLPYKVSDFRQWLCPTCQRGDLFWHPDTDTFYCDGCKRTSTRLAMQEHWHKTNCYEDKLVHQALEEYRKGKYRTEAEAAEEERIRQEYAKQQQLEREKAKRLQDRHRVSAPQEMERLYLKLKALSQQVPTLYLEERSTSPAIGATVEYWGGPLNGIPYTITNLERVYKVPWPHNGEYRLEQLDSKWFWVYYGPEDLD